jgi:hypothetical protein
MITTENYVIKWPKELEVTAIMVLDEPSNTIFYQSTENGL